MIYNPDTMLGVRVPWDIPVEDFGFGFAMVTLDDHRVEAGDPREPASQPAATGKPTRDQPDGSGRTEISVTEVGTASGRAVTTAARTAAGSRSRADSAIRALVCSPTSTGPRRRYDLMVALNPGYHRHLRSAAQALVDPLTDAGPD